MKSSAVTVIVSVAAGVVLALLTGFINVTPSGLLGATWYGFPRPWLYRLIIAPQYYPWREDWGNLATDIAAWSVLAVALGLSALVLSRRREPVSKS